MRVLAALEEILCRALNFETEKLGSNSTLTQPVLHPFIG